MREKDGVRPEAIEIYCEFGSSPNLSPKIPKIDSPMRRDFEQKALIVTRRRSYLRRAGGSEALCQNIKALVVAAADEDYYNRKDYDPSTVVVKDVA